MTAEHRFFHDPCIEQRDIIYFSIALCIRFFKRLRVDCATGPDHLGCRILRFIRPFIAAPFVTLVRRMIDEAFWPDIWKHHWLIPLYKRNSVFQPRNYRGIHITSNLSKAVSYTHLTLPTKA